MKWTKDEIRAVQALNDNWHVLEKVLMDDVLEACFGMGDKADMSEAEIHFRRGAIHATRNFSHLPKRMLMAAESQVAMEVNALTDEPKKS